MAASVMPGVGEEGMKEWSASEGARRSRARVGRDRGGVWSQREAVEQSQIANSLRLTSPSAPAQRPLRSRRFRRILVDVADVRGRQ